MFETVASMRIFSSTINTVKASAVKNHNQVLRPELYNRIRHFSNKKPMTAENVSSDPVSSGSYP